MLKKIIALTMAVLLAVLLIGCTEKPGNTDEPPKAGYINNKGQTVALSLHATDENILYSTEYNKLYTEANNGFAITMANAFDKGWTGVFSPLSLQIALQILANGGDEETAQELLNTVCPGLTREDVNASAANLISKLLKSEGVTMNSAVVVNNAYQLSEKFANTAADYYRSSVGALDFSNPAKATKEINKWISENTGGLIKELLDTLPANTAIVLLNTLLLKLNWEKPFVTMREATEFHGSKGDKMISMLTATNTYGYSKCEQGQLVIVPYEGGEYNMAVILPAEGVSPAEAVAAMLGTFDDCQPATIKLSMPHVDINSKHDILEMAAKLNLEAGLHGGYPGLIDEGNVEITKVLQGASLSVTESGTTAAAATAIVGTKNAGFSKAEAEVICDRPYAMVIYNVETSTVLFVSIVSDVD